jgi:hypothetical protein
MKRSDAQNRLLRINLDRTRCHYVIAFLNETGGDRQAKEQVTEVFELFRQLDSLQRVGRNFPDQVSAGKHLNSVLKAFLYTPYVAVMPGKRPPIIWREAPGDSAEIPTTSTAFIVSNIIAAYERGTLERIRKCLCGSWFFAESAKKVVCSDACRFRKFKEGKKESFNEERAAYMREYRGNPRVKASKRAKNGTSKTR